MILNKTTKDIIDKISKRLNIPSYVVTVVYRSYWEFIKHKIENLPDLESISEEDFNKLNVNFNIPEIGKFTTSFEKIQKAINYKKIVIKNLNGKL